MDRIYAQLTWACVNCIKYIAKILITKIMRCRYLKKMASLVLWNMGSICSGISTFSFRKQTCSEMLYQLVAFRY
jgi:hypothetical protein